MKLEKLKLDAFVKNSLSFSALKSLVGAAEYTTHNSPYDDFIDNKGITSFSNCGKIDDAPCKV